MLLLLNRQRELSSCHQSRIVIQLIMSSLLAQQQFFPLVPLEQGSQYEILASQIFDIIESSEHLIALRL